MFDYSSVLKDLKIANSWEQFWNDDKTEAENLESIIRRIVILPNDFYKILTAYLFIPSALSRVVPYLFLYDQSGSGKSKYLCKIICKKIDNLSP